MTVAYGPEADDFVCIPAHSVHRESVGPEGESGVIVRVGGSGPTVINVDVPESSSQRPARRRRSATERPRKVGAFHLPSFGEATPASAP